MEASLLLVSLLLLLLLLFEIYKHGNTYTAINGPNYSLTI